MSLRVWTRHKSRLVKQRYAVVLSEGKNPGSVKKPNAKIDLVYDEAELAFCVSEIKLMSSVEIQCNNH